jgi:hypothetical protein
MSSCEEDARKMNQTVWDACVEKKFLPCSLIPQDMPFKSTTHVNSHDPSQQPPCKTSKEFVDYFKVLRDVHMDMSTGDINAKCPTR